MSSDEECETYVFYKDRPDWRDVEPVPQNDGECPVVRIAYSDKFKDVFDYFRAMLQRDERSERAFELTTTAIALNSANYTVWQFRRILLRHLDKDLYQELDYVSDMIEQNTKNYQVWHHRRCIVEWLNDHETELDFTAKVLEEDSKNYHAWQHRQWVLKEFRLWDDEIDYVDTLLEKDLRNNSAWNQRFYVIYNTDGFTREVMKTESSVAMSYIRKAPNNESSWNYLRGVLQEESMNKFPGVMSFCDELYAKGMRSAHLLGFIVDCLEEQLEEDKQLSKSSRVQILNRAVQLCTSLADDVDTIRVEYWRHISRTLSTRFEPDFQSGDS